MNRIKSLGVAYALFVLFWMVFFLPVARYIQLNFGLDVGFVRIALVVFALSGVSVFAWWMFRNDRISAWLRMCLGYLILLLGTWIVRRAMGVWLFRRFVALWLFALICAVVYAAILLGLRLSQKKQAERLNEALGNAARTQDRK